MKKTILRSFLVIMTFLFISAFAVFAEADLKTKAVDDAMAAIQKEQSAKTPKDIDAQKVNDVLLADLGKALMDANCADPKEKELCDNMHSTLAPRTLKSMQMMMGYRFLKGGPMGMMQGPCMDGPNDMMKGPMGHMKNNGPMMWNGPKGQGHFGMHRGFGWIVPFLLMTLYIALIAFLTLYIYNRMNNKGKTVVAPKKIARKK
jgi:hypothetical protein